jgi:hypothetical protein
MRGERDDDEEDVEVGGVIVKTEPGSVARTRRTIPQHDEIAYENVDEDEDQGDDAPAGPVSPRPAAAAATPNVRSPFP